MILPRKYPADFHQLEKVLHREKPDRPVLFEYAILHSCGNLTDVIDDIVDDMKYDAKHY